MLSHMDRFEEDLPYHQTLYLICTSSKHRVLSLILTSLWCPSEGFFSALTTGGTKPDAWAALTSCHWAGTDSAWGTAGSWSWSCRWQRQCPSAPVGSPGCWGGWGTRPGTAGAWRGRKVWLYLSCCIKRWWHCPFVRRHSRWPVS